MPFDGALAAEPMSADVVLALQAGRARLVRGWCQFTYHAQEGRWWWRKNFYCMWGALALEWRMNDDRAASLLAVAIDDLGIFERDHGPDTTVTFRSHLTKIADANDHPNRTKADCLEVYDRAIAIAQSRMEVT